MTRKKSKVKALALAVTCAILAGGYSGVGTVYAADVNADNITVSGNITAAGGKITAGFFDNVNKIRLVDDTTNSKYIIDIIAGDYGGIEVSGKNSTGDRLKTKLGADGIISSDKGIKVGVNGKAFVVDVDSNEGNVSATGSLSVAGGKFLAKKDGTLQVEDELVISHTGSNTEADPSKSAKLNIDRLGKLNQLVEYSSGAQTVITAGDGSTIGGVGFNAGALTGVTSINANDEYAKFRVAPSVEDDNGEKHYIFRAGNLEIATDINAEGSLPSPSESNSVYINSTSSSVHAFFAFIFSAPVFTDVLFAVIIEVGMANISISSAFPAMSMRRVHSSAR